MTRRRFGSLGALALAAVACWLVGRIARPRGAALLPAQGSLATSATVSTSRWLGEGDDTGKTQRVARSSTPHRVCVTVVDTLGQPLSGACVLPAPAHGDSDSAAGVLTDALGRAMLSVPFATDAIQASAACHGPGTARLGPETEQVVIRLDRLRTIHGQVRTRDGSRLPPSVSVLAWPKRAGRSNPRFLMDPLTRSTVAREDGSYELQEVPGRAWLVVAGGAGFLTLDAVQPAADCSYPTDLTITPVLCAGVQLQLPGGAAPCLPVPMFNTWTGLACSSRGSRLIPSDTAEAVLAGLPEAFAGSDKTRRAYLVEATEADAVVKCIVRFPGFMDVGGFQLSFRPLASGLAVAPVALQRDGTAQGSLTLELQGPLPEGFCDVRANSPVACLVLAPAQRGIHLGYDLTELRETRLRLDCVPHGPYTLSLRTEWMSIPLAEWNVSGGSEILSVDLDPRDFGTLELDVEVHGAEYEDRLCALIEPVAVVHPHVRRGWSSLFFEGPPYRIDFLPPGEYSLLVSAGVTAPLSNAPLSVELAAGARARLAVGVEPAPHAAKIGPSLPLVSAEQR